MCAEVHQEFGDVRKGFAGSDVIRTTVFKNKRQDAAFLEPPGCIADFDRSGRMTLYSSTQVPHYVQRTVAMVLGLDVDMKTGQITIENMTDAHDCGFAINRTSVESQMEGSLSMGMGEAMFEEVKFDDKGNVINSDLAEYKLVCAVDMPPVKTIIQLT
ncbi:MAG: molybdopterin-dependent oxidoreductase [Desulfobacteraceae bacterium]|nr:molybdopterin-dependent oxidoreductase [Desulfobacteraceae bacterium]